MEEYLDVVTENNEPTGEERLRSEIHTLGLWHRTVHVYLFQEVGSELRFLVHLRSKTKDLHPNTWDTRFGGHLKAGEDFQSVVAHELQEEIGLTLSLTDLIEGKIHKSDGGLNKEFTAIYYCRFGGDIASLKFNDGEVQEVRWMSANDIVRAMNADPGSWTSTPGGFMEICDDLKKRLA